MHREVYGIYADAFSYLQHYCNMSSRSEQQQQQARYWIILWDILGRCPTKAWIPGEQAARKHGSLKDCATPRLRSIMVVDLNFV